MLSGEIALKITIIIITYIHTHIHTNLGNDIINTQVWFIAILYPAYDLYSFFSRDLIYVHYKSIKNC